MAWREGFDSLCSHFLFVFFPVLFSFVFFCGEPKLSMRGVLIFFVAYLLLAKYFKYRRKEKAERGNRSRSSNAEHPKNLQV